MKKLSTFLALGLLLVGLAGCAPTDEKSDKIDGKDKSVENQVDVNGKVDETMTNEKQVDVNAKVLETKSDEKQVEVNAKVPDVTLEKEEVDVKATVEK